MNDDKEKRPRIVEIIKRLNEAGPTIDQENNIIVPTYGLTAHTTHDIVVSHPYANWFFAFIRSSSKANLSGNVIGMSWTLNLLT